MDDHAVLRVVDGVGDILEIDRLSAAPFLSAEEQSHLRSMCTRIPLLLEEGKREKVMRWLGFAQGYLVRAGRLSLEGAKRMNAPPGAEYDANLDSMEAIEARRGVKPC